MSANSDFFIKTCDYASSYIQCTCITCTYANWWKGCSVHESNVSKAVFTCINVCACDLLIYTLTTTQVVYTYSVSTLRISPSIIMFFVQSVVGKFC